MTTLNFSLPERLKKWVEAQVAAGGYGNTSEYIRELIRMDQRRKEQERLETLLLKGLDSGTPVEMSREAWAELKRRVGSRRVGKKRASGEQG